MATVLSLNVGRGGPGAPRGALTGIDKRPVPQITVADPGPRVAGGGSGVEDDFVGERWRVGDTVELVVATPRIPCATFALRMGIERWTERFLAHGRTGAYFSVAVPGTIKTGAPITVIERPEHGVALPALLRALRGDAELAEHVLAVCRLHPVVRGALEHRLARR